jgi:hypothetical protein
MFHPTKPLLKRTPLRLLGFRGPAIRVLRHELARLSPSSRTVPFAGPDRTALPPPAPSVLGPRPAVLGRRFSDLFSDGRRTRRGGGGWAEPSTARWAHSIYAFDERHMKTLPVTTKTSLRALSAYLNMLPRSSSSSSSALDLLPEPWAAQAHVRGGLFRAFTSDRSRASAIRQDLVGKLKRGRREGFWRVLRAAMAWEPAVAFKHYPARAVEVRAFVHDVRIDVLREQAGRLRREILDRLRMRRPRTEASSV